jgi:hypothetical protein
MGAMQVGILAIRRIGTSSHERLNTGFSTIGGMNLTDVVVLIATKWLKALQLRYAMRRWQEYGYIRQASSSATLITL